MKTLFNKLERQKRRKIQKIYDYKMKRYEEQNPGFYGLPMREILMVQGRLLAEAHKEFMRQEQQEGRTQ